MWNFVTDWAVVAILGPAIIAIGFGALSMTPPEIKFALGCFAVGYLIILAKISWWMTFDRTDPDWQRSLFVGMTFLAFGILWFWSSIFALSKLPKPVITIIPKQVVFGEPDSRHNAAYETYTFRITNNTDDDIYQITFKLRVHSETISAEKFKYDVPKSSWKPMAENDPEGSRIGDICGMDCRDAKNRPVFLRFIRRLGPRESREVTLSRLGEDRQKVIGLPSTIGVPNTQGPGAVVVTAEVSYFTHDSKPVLSVGNNFRAVPIYVDETLTCGHTNFIVLS